MFDGFFLFYALLALFNSVNALRKPVTPGAGLPPLWLPALIVSELTTPVLVSRLAIGGLFVGFGAHESGPGRTALTILILSILGLAPQYGRTARAIGHSTVGDGAKRQVDVEVTTDIPYDGGLTLDMYSLPSIGDPAPTMLYFHGGSWTGGDPHRAGKVMFRTLANAGWKVATVRYPLSPAATFPDHVIAVKRAITWAKRAGAEYGIDPDRIVVAGGSAGAHLATLAGLTAGVPELQPGFEAEDTSVAAVVALYGVFDFLNRNKTRWDWPVIPRDVMKALPSDAPDLYRLASPLDHAHEAAPPVLVIHGSHDSLVPPAEARHFVEALSRESRSHVEYLEVHGAQHGFDAFDTPRSRMVAARVSTFLESALATT
ncbi:MAG: alpha/beta hydrolase [Acidimicrobiia bacterium]|nr:alpha/beta hydrolase [Acidimicrobiia bacterium]MDH4307780.1 alpha/beta hydrolase [Acidimicrobiia bacterium]MDH5292540.1 alpha/beta hydrolase [Acidimicrobiia bacterium]